MQLHSTSLSSTRMVNDTMCLFFHEYTLLKQLIRELSAFNNKQSTMETVAAFLHILVNAIHSHIAYESIYLNLTRMSQHSFADLKLFHMYCINLFIY